MTVRPREQGFALLIVLWSLVLIALLLTGLAASARSAARLASNLRGAAELQAIADGAIHTAIFGLVAGTGQVPGQEDADVAVSVRVSALGGFINPNTAPPELLRALLLRSGVEPGRANALAAAIAAWRQPGRKQSGRATYRAAGLAYGPPGAPFETLDELRLVLGMTPAIAAAMMPHLSLFAPGDPDPALAGSIVRAALGELGNIPRARRRAISVVRITARASRGDATAVREAIVGIGTGRRTWRVLNWVSVPG